MASSSDQSSSESKLFFPEHWPLSEIQEGLSAGTVFQGKFQASRENCVNGSIFIRGEDESDSKSIFVEGRKNSNRAVDGDDVAVLILDEDERTPSSRVLEDKTKSVEGDDNKTSTFFLFKPFECRVPNIKVRIRQEKALSSKRIIASIDLWPRNSKYPVGHCVQPLEEVGEKDTESQVLLFKHDIPHKPFSKAVLDCLPVLPWIITDADAAVRKDLRELEIFTVDPPDCTDIDDALHCRKLENGNLEVGVHIADVSHFIRPGSAIDAEAAIRGTTVYLVDRQIDMVPELLSSNLCSLRGNEERFAFTVIWEMTEDAKILRTSYFKSIIKSKATLTYADAQMRIDDKSLNDDTTLSLRYLNKLAKILRKQRIENGAIIYKSPGLKVVLDNNKNDPIDVECKELKETNSMVEELMILANSSVAQRILEEFPDCALLRNNPPPEVSKFEPLIKAALSKGFAIQIESNKVLAESLEKAVVQENPNFNVLLRRIAAQCMAQSLYICSGTLPKSDYVHYGLGVNIYTHFTSPIRRFSDLIVHRLLAIAIGADVPYPELVDKKKTQELCSNLNYRHKQAQHCAGASINLYIHIFLKDKIVEEEGYVLSIQKDALRIFVPKYGLESNLSVSSTSNKEKCDSVTKKNDAAIFEYDKTGPSLSSNGVILNLFDPVIVQLHIDRSNIQYQKTVLKLVKPYIPNFSVPAKTDEPPTKKLKLSA